MSETDSFIDEVTEEVRRDRLFAIFRKYAWIGILAVVLIVGGAAWREWHKAQATASAQAFGDAMVSALNADDPAARVAALDAIGAGEGEKAALRHAVTAFAAADAMLAAGDRDGALARLETLGAVAELPPIYRQLAQLKAVLVAGTNMDSAERDATLAELSQPGAPYRVLALEQQVIALMSDGKNDEAIAEAKKVLQEPDVSAGLQRRLMQMIVVLGGTPDAT